ncbi:hypothetical protein GCM10010415_54660 [Streptomyces atrovirens]
MAPSVQGDVGFDRGMRTLFTMDASDHRRVPVGIVGPSGRRGREAVLVVERTVRVADALDARIVTDPAGQRALWRIREDASGTATRMPGWKDRAVPPARPGASLSAESSPPARHTAGPHTTRSARNPDTRRQRTP